MKIEKRNIVFYLIIVILGVMLTYFVFQNVFFKYEDTEIEEIRRDAPEIIDTDVRIDN